MTLTPKMRAFLRVMRQPGSLGWTAGMIAGHAGYGHSLGRNGASPQRTLYALLWRGLVRFDGHRRWSITDEGRRALRSDWPMPEPPPYPADDEGRP